MAAQPDETVALPVDADRTVGLPGDADQTVALGFGAETVAVPTQAIRAVPAPTGVPTVAIPNQPAPTAGGEATVAIPVPPVSTGSAATVAIPTQAVPVRDSASGHHQPTGYQAGAQPTGYQAGAQPTGYQAGAQPTGYRQPTGGRTSRSGRGSDPVPAGGAEIRFGPGVPAPPEAPAWRRPGGAGGPGRRPSPWRRLAALLSTVLTVILVAVVGLYLWQRISPLEITSVTAAVPNPPGDQCDVTIDVVATVRTNGRAGTIRYQWLRSGAEPSTLLTERVGWGQRTVVLRLKWAFTGVGTARETATVNIVSPTPVQAQAGVTYHCPRG